MNVVFDCLYWWRKLFLTQNNSRNQHFGSTNPVIAGEIVEGYSELNQSLFDDWESWGFDWGFDFSESLNIPTAANEEVTV
ncbi:hypothetical protein SLS60_002490 [Paraconiothyrium brasiliense]|uniref:Uncharacterized protein n=1 Tax=Paraconiothyrium brasiliense TaxID=300254 RepID=A0ABR3S2B3_9PLEO